MKMKLAKLALALAAAASTAIPAGQPGPQTQREFECYVQAAEARMEARQATVPAGERGIQTIGGNGANPHKLSGGHLYDWIGTSFIPGASLEKLIRMLQDYDHRAAYFPETIATSKLLCRTGKDRFRYTMRMKEPAVIDVESEVIWEQVDARHWRCRSYSIKVAEAGKDHGYLRRLNSYWRFSETGNGVFVDAETITLSDEFGGMTRALGSALMGINPEKSLKHSLEAMRASVLKPGLDIPAPPAGLPECGAATPRPSPTGCPAAPAR
jgi:hypothetical protein